MCRIFGNLGASPLSERDLDALHRHQRGGGPDQQAHRSGPSWSLGANRLAIQGLDGGAQPYRHGEDIIAVLNGEIYNHDQLRQDLRARGYRFADHCDGSLIPALYLEHGDRFVELLDGMFALAVIDLRQQGRPRLLLANDPLGTKSAYFWYRAGEFVFSSELPALLAVSRVSSELRPEAIDLYLSMLAVLGSDTAFRDVQQLAPASHVVVEPGRAPVVRTYRTSIVAPEPAQDLAKVGVQLRELLDEEVRSLLSADVPVALITSGGLDSSLLTAMAARHQPGLHTFNIAYRGDWPADERGYAEQVARASGAVYHQVEADPADFPELLPQMVAHLGQPNAAPHCLSTYVLFREVRAAGFKVAVAGEGADELFGGYERFAVAAQGGPGWAERYLDAMAPVPARIRDAIYTPRFAAISSHADSPTSRIRATMAGLGARPTLEDLLRFDQVDRFPYYILRRADHLSMASSVEVRVPFCQPRIVDFARSLGPELKISEGKVKRPVYAAAEGLVPAEVLHRKKQPFTLPVGAMLREGQPLFGYATERLRGSTALADYLVPSAVAGLLAEQRERPSDPVAKSLWALLVLDLWLEQVRTLRTGS
ncbi:N-acetylglutaminylglutamine amidotransferase [Kutzneria viridogrisea]|uniref:asparagine synthase (glutamine-hydrolyzing) n=1 Tax=Kutzneria viridogrisea TaxID=47990 RepID=A0ABR6BJN2_9PSEU|nr:asparagine synthase (glutamine-hydrolyzing) [Kutzneria viridogrisea]